MISALLICNRITDDDGARVPAIDRHQTGVGWVWSEQGRGTADKCVVLLNYPSDTPVEAVQAALADQDIVRVWSEGDAPYPLTDPDQVPTQDEIDAIEAFTGVSYAGGTRREYGQRAIHELAD